MAEQRAAILRQQRLSSLGLRFPLWIFEADDPRWPRRLDSLISRSTPARLTGWIVSFSEYKQHLTPLQDLCHISEGHTTVPSITRSQRAHLVQSAMNQLRYDDRYGHDALQVVFEASGEQTAQTLSAWVFERTEIGWVDPVDVQRIERIWDHVPLFDPIKGLTQVSDFGSTADTCFGVATLVADDDELVSVSGILATDGGEDIRRAAFECLDEEGISVRAVVCPSRDRETGDHGLMLNAGPKDKRNMRLLAGTKLQNAPWEEVVEYRKGNRSGPLW